MGLKSRAFSNRQAAMNDLSSGSAAGSSLDFDTPLKESASQMGLGRYWTKMESVKLVITGFMIFYSVLRCSMIFYVHALCRR